MTDSIPPAPPADSALASLAAVERVAASLVRGDGDAAHIGEAASAARRLFTSPASREAREIEGLLSGGSALDDAAIYRLTVLTDAARRALTAPSAGTAPPAQGSDTQPVRVVVVDDDPVMLALLSQSLSAHGITVTTVSQSKVAVETILREAPDLAIIDVDMPDPNGLAVCREVRAHPETADLPIICFTSHTERTVIASLFEAGIDDHIEKPAAPAEIAMRVRNRLARARRQRPAPVASAPQAAANVPRYDVVVIDDDRVMTAVLAQMLLSRGYSMEVIADGATAVERLAGPSPSITARAILLDVSLPGLDGMAVLRAFAKAGVTKRSRVIMLTARSLESEVVQALDLGAIDHVAKPFSIPVLMQRLRVALESAPS